MLMAEGGQERGVKERGREGERERESEWLFWASRRMK
jgi:hypothetical protein